MYPAVARAGPIPILKRFARDLGRFTGLRGLELQKTGTHFAVRDDLSDVVVRSMQWELLPQLEVLLAKRFYNAVLKPSTAAAGQPAVDAASGAAPAQLLAGVTTLYIVGAASGQLNSPLPRLASLVIQAESSIRLDEEQLHLPQLTSLKLHLPNDCAASLRCGSMPALRHLHSTSGGLWVCDSDATQPQLTHLGLRLKLWSTEEEDEQTAAWLQKISCSLRSLSLKQGFPDVVAAVNDMVFDAAAAGQQLTYLVGPCCTPLLLSLYLQWSCTFALLHRDDFSLQACCSACGMLAFRVWMRWGCSANAAWHVLRQLACSTLRFWRV